MTMTMSSRPTGRIGATNRAADRVLVTPDRPDALIRTTGEDLAS